MNVRWVAWLSILLMSSSCVDSRRFADGGASGAASQMATAGQGGDSGADPGAEPQAGSASDAFECFPGPDGKVPSGCVPGTSLAAGDGFNCGLLVTGGVYCWGTDLDGQVTGAPQTGDFISVAAGRRHACALHPDGTLQCWGNNSQQQAPAITTSDDYGRFASIACGDDFTCGVHLDGSPLCFGSPAHGKLDAPEGKYLMIAAGTDTACGVRNKQVVCWGDDSSHLVRDASGGVVKTVAVGPEHACAITVDRQMNCWGDAGTTDPTPGAQVGATRTDVRPGSYLAVSAGGEHTAAITVGDRFTCFGDISATRQCMSPNSAENFGEWYQVAAGRVHTCILGDPEGPEPNGTVQCFGQDRGAESPDNLVFKSGR